MFYASLGFVLFLLVYFIFGPPVKTYIIEHELTHIIFALLSGIKIKGVSFKKSHSYVKTNRVNIFVALAPYSFPLYTLLVIAIYKVVKNFFYSNIVSSVFYFLMGASLSFHLTVTLHYIQLDQPDMKRWGYFSSMVFILLWSIIVLSVILALMFKRVELIYFYKSSICSAGSFYKSLFSLVFFL